ncbi:PTS sugar transporter subunit IIA [Vagococcus acidifermentans]|uniref:PTS sugar transporter subunit IIA n=1 Tax=Vagococcus acidifermentans TaxID=564710 RepID=A0A430ALP3_9ENTE|nr:PTS sugar transporter subunit IIA [Vagococcus acidifermentans]RSU09041.1 PTS sugar transporter subunit IIA [Vagococcus acidifermentans]
MIGVLLVSHGKMADGIKDSINLIMGESDNLETSSLVAGQGFDEFKADVAAKTKQLDEGEGVLVFVDLFGASPYNAAMMSFKELEQSGTAIRVLTGMNLSMILEVLAMRTGMDLDQLADLAVESGCNGIQETTASVSNDASEEEEDDY